MTNTIKRGIALLASVVTFIFFFLKTLAIKMSGTVMGTEVSESESLKYFDFLFKDEYAEVREQFELTTAIMWVALVLVALAVVVTALAFLTKNNKFSKIGALLAVVGMVVLFVVNLDTMDMFGVKMFVTNLTALYFVALAISAVGLVAALTNK